MYVSFLFLFEGSEGSGSLTWYDHQDAVCHDEDFHGVDDAHGRKNATIDDEVADELDVEDGAEPKDGDSAHDGGPLDGPEEVLGGHDSDDGVVLDNGVGKAGANSQEDNDGGAGASGGLCGAGPKGDHGPGLVDEGGLDDDEEGESEGVCGEARVPVAAGDGGEVAGPDLVKVADGGDKVGKEEAGADGAEEQADEVQGRGRAAGELGGRGEGDDDDEHDEAGAELGAVVHGGAEGLVVVGVEDGHGHRGGGDVVGEEEGDVAGEPVKGRVGGGR